MSSSLTPFSSFSNPSSILLSEFSSKRQSDYNCSETWRATHWELFIVATEDLSNPNLQPSLFQVSPTQAQITSLPTGCSWPPSLQHALPIPKDLPFLLLFPVSRTPHSSHSCQIKLFSSFKLISWVTRAFFRFLWITEFPPLHSDSTFYLSVRLCLPHVLLIYDLGS